MRPSTIFSVLSSLAFVSAHGPDEDEPAAVSSTTAKQVTNNPKGAAYIARLPATAGVQGTVSVASALAGKSGVQVSISFTGLPATGAPFMYHIHDKPVPSDGNCTGTAAHFDPYNRGETPACNAATPANCQIGDYSGKYGNITAGPTFSKSFVDPYSSLVKGDKQYIGGKSIVVHLTDKKRIGCANFTSTGM